MTWVCWLPVQTSNAERADSFRHRFYLYIFSLTRKTASLPHGVTFILGDLIQITVPVHQPAPMRSLTTQLCPYCLLWTIHSTHFFEPCNMYLPTCINNPFSVLSPTARDLTFHFPSSPVALVLLPCISYSVFRLLPEYVMVNGEAGGYVFV